MLLMFKKVFLFYSNYDILSYIFYKESDENCLIRKEKRDN